MKFCKDCKYFKGDPAHAKFAECRHPSAVKHIDLVWGESVYHMAHEMRNEGTLAACGTKASWFVNSADFAPAEYETL